MLFSYESVSEVSVKTLHLPLYTTEHKVIPRDIKEQQLYYIMNLMGIKPSTIACACDF